MKREPKTFKVYMQEGRYYVEGLVWDGPSGGDTMLMYHIPYPETETPEVDNPEGHDEMHGSLYDLYQWHEGLRAGDRFETPFGNFVCCSFHVVTEQVYNRLKADGNLEEEP